MSLRPAHRESAPRLEEVLEAGLHAMRVAPVSTAPRGFRLHPEGNEDEEFMAVRRRRLTSSLLPFWVRLQGERRQSMSRNKIVRILADNGGHFQYEVPANPRSAEIVREMMTWGRDNEDNAILGYMEITHALVGLGNTRKRLEPVAGENTINQARTDVPDSVPAWDWHNMMSATPDGFVREVAEDPEPGLIEIKCPASLYPSDPVGQPGMLRRYDVDWIMRFEDDRYIQVQAFMHLNVCREARYCDLVYYKRASLDPDEPNAHIWLARLYKDDAVFNELRAALESSFDSFARAMWVAQNGLPDDYEALKLDDKGKKAIVAALDRWIYRSLKYRNSLEAEFPWRSRYEVVDLLKGSTGGLCQRYKIPTGEAFTHEGQRGTRGYTPCIVPNGMNGAGGPLNARHLWPTEYVGSV